MPSSRPGAPLPLPDEHEERAAYVLDGEVEVAGDRFEPGRMLVFRAGDRLALRAGPQGARLLLLGGAAMDGPRHLFWNFVSLQPRADRAGQGRLEGRALRQGAGRREGIHPAAGGAHLGARRDAAGERGIADQLIHCIGRVGRGRRMHEGPRGRCTSPIPEQGRHFAHG